LRLSSSSIVLPAEPETTETVMHDLLGAIRMQLAETPLCRRIVLVGVGETVTSEWLLVRVHFRQIPQLREKAQILHNYGLVQADTEDPADDSSYWISEELARYLQVSYQADNAAFTP